MALVGRVLTDKSLVIVFAYAPAGLGHLRVSDTLYHGLPKGVIPVLLGSDDRSISLMHRITSVHPLGRRLMETFQNGKAEDMFTYLYRNFLRSRSGDLFTKLAVVLEQRIDIPKKVLMVATHFGLAHQLSAIKDRVARELKVKVILAVVVTDDSPQHVWYVPKADITFVPSRFTKDKLIEYGAKTGLIPNNFEVVPYPLNPLLSKKLPQKKWEDKRNQLDGHMANPINISMPVSGAAVGIDYLRDLILKLHEQSDRYTFHIVSKISLYTRSFLQAVSGYPFVRLKVAFSDRETVNDYDDLYTGNVISLEVTKPSEQAFKSLFSPRVFGGPVMLFVRPVGRQEYDNLNFLKNHGLIPPNSLAGKLKKISGAGKREKREILDNLKERTPCFRGIELPDDPGASAFLIRILLEKGIFLKMADYRCGNYPSGKRREEITADGVEIIWQKLAEYLENMK